MDISQFVNLKNLEDFFEGEIKEISERYGKFLITQVALERWFIEHPVTDEEQAGYQEVATALAEAVAGHKGKKEEIETHRTLDKFPEETRNQYEKVKEYKDKEESLQRAKDGLKEFAEFLEVVDGLKRSIKQ